jgi:hypothetical protein
MSRCFAYSEAFDPDDPTLMDHYPTYDTNTDLGDRPPTLTCSFSEDFSMLMFLYMYIETLSEVTHSFLFNTGFECNMD